MSDETLAFLFDLSKDAPDRAIDQIKSLQARVAQAFTAASVLIGFEAFASLPGHNASRAALGALAAAGMIYAVIAIISVVTLLPTFAWGLPNPRTLVERYGAFEVPSIQQALMNGIIRDMPRNAQLIRSAGSAATWCVRLLAVEALAMGVALLLSLVTSGAAAAH
jgi:hypothetical protein